MGFSTLPVREAIRRLEAEGLIVFKPNTGAAVAPADPALFDEMVTSLAVLEGYATALAAPELQATDIDHLKQINARMIVCMDQLDALGFGRANREFHMFIYERCPNSPIVELLRNTERQLDAIRRTVFTHIPYRGRKSIQEHEQIIRLLRIGAPTSKIEQAARNHKLETGRAFREWRAAAEADSAVPVS